MMNLVRWRKCTGELFGVGQLITRLVDGCMVDVADGGWDVGGEELLRKVRTTNLSLEWRPILIGVVR